MVEQVEVKLPNPMSVGEYMAKGMTFEQATNKMNELVFGVGYQTDSKGKPVERGKGSAAQPTPQHQEALRIAQEHLLAKRGGNATSPQDIATAVAEAVRGLKGPDNGALDAASIAAIVGATVKSMMAEIRADEAAKKEDTDL